MNTRKLRKMILTLCSALLLVSMSVGITVAYLTDTEVVTNTFSVGNVEITLDEAKVKYDETKNAWVEDGAARVTENQYKLLPGVTITKDPTVTVKKGSEEAYIRILVTVNNISNLKTIFPNDVAADGTFLLQNFLNNTWDSTTWKFEKATADSAANKTVYEFRYKETVDLATATEDKTLPALFTTIVMPTSIDGEDLAKLTADDPETEVYEGLQIDIVAQAMQADGFADANAAWNAWNN